MLFRWWIRQPRLWICLAALAGGVAFTGPDQRPAWTVTVGVLLAVLTAVVLRLYFVDHFPGWAAQKEARARARLEADAAAVLERYRIARAPAEPAADEPPLALRPPSRPVEQPQPQAGLEEPAPEVAPEPVRAPVVDLTLPLAPRTPPQSHRKGHANARRKRRARKRRKG